MKFRATEVLNNILPVGGVVVTTKIGLEFTTENLQGGTLANTVGSDKTKNLIGTGHRQTMELEAVGAISVGNLALEIGGQVDNCNGIKRTLLGADTTTDAQRLGDEGQLRLGRNFNAQLSTTDNRA